MVLLSSCKRYDRTADMIMFDTKKVYPVLKKQTLLLNKLPITNGRVSVYWKIKNGIFDLNTLTSNVNHTRRDSVLLAWGLSLPEYQFLEESSRKLNELGICGAFNPADKIFTFEYRCDIKGFGESGRFIFLKEDILTNVNVANGFPVLLDEKQWLVLKEY